LKGLEAEKWFFMELYQGCELECRPLPKSVVKSQGHLEGKHTFTKKRTLITYSSGDKVNQEKIEDILDSKHGDAFFICL